MGSFCSCLKGEEESSMVRRVVSPSEVKRPFTKPVRRRKSSKGQEANHEGIVRPEITNRRTSIEIVPQRNPPPHTAETVAKKQEAPSVSASDVASVAQMPTRLSTASYLRNSSNSPSESLADDLSEMRYWAVATSNTSELLERETIGDIGTFTDDATMTQKTIVDEYEGSPITTPTSMVPRSDVDHNEALGFQPVSHGAEESDEPVGSGERRDESPTFSRDDSHLEKKGMSREHTRLKYESHLPVSFLVQNFEKIEANSKLR